MTREETLSPLRISADFVSNSPVLKLPRFLLGDITGRYGTLTTLIQ